MALEWCDFTPGTDLYQVLIHQNLTTASALSELIDNAFDAGATRVVIEFDRHGMLRVTDDGTGVSDPLILLRYSVREAHVTTRLGRYGVGATDALAHFNGTVSIASVHAGVQRMLVGFKFTDKLEGWRGLFERDTRPAAADTHGTHIIVSHCRKRLPNQKQLAAIRDELSETFAPGLHQQKQIILNGVLLVPLESPSLIAVEQGHVDCGKGQAEFMVGIVRDGEPNPRYGIALGYAHRILRSHTAIGCGEASMRNIFGEVTLTGKWGIEKNKRALDEDEHATLDAALRDRLALLIQRAQTETMSVENTELAARVSALLNQVIEGVRPVREKRTKRGGEGTHDRGTRTNVPRRATRFEADPNAQAIVPGTSGGTRRRSPGRFFIDWVTMADQSAGNVDLSQYRICLNENLSIVASAKRNRDEHTTAVVALALLAEEWMRAVTPTAALPFKERGTTQEFAALFGRLLAGLNLVRLTAVPSAAKAG